MANNRIALQCKKCEGEPFFFLKYFPSGGWYGPNKGLSERLNKWLDEHKHDCGSNMFGLGMIELVYQVVGDNTDSAEQILNALVEVVEVEKKKVFFPFMKDYIKRLKKYLKKNPEVLDTSKIKLIKKGE